jgi:hypothetical protein
MRYTVWGSRERTGHLGRRHPDVRAVEVFEPVASTSSSSTWKVSPERRFATDLDPDVVWISVAESARTSLLLEDRAAKYLPDQNLLQIKAEFRVSTDMIAR